MPNLLTLNFAAAAAGAIVMGIALGYVPVPESLASRALDIRDLAVAQFPGSGDASENGKVLGTSLSAGHEAKPTSVIEEPQLSLQPMTDLLFIDGAGPALMPEPANR